MMRFCPFCGTEMLSEEAAFCMGCGNKLPKGKGRTQKKNNIGKTGKEKPVIRQKPMRTRRSNAVTSSEIPKDERSNQYETDDIMGMYAEEQLSDQRQDEDNRRDVVERKHNNPPICKRRIPVDDYDGYYDDVVPYDKGRVKEDNILEMVKKVFVIIIAALLIVAVCVVMMYVL